ncbi:MAG: lysophospholipase [Bacteroidales bacterium]|jgi:alpha-beta hydrolase superfamily lysophospholipase|nr:lysophospholipase [Bacteroidales bacterium]
MEYSIVLKNGMVLRGVISAPGGIPKAFILFVHGLGEHIGRYDHWTSYLRSSGIGFTGVDLPGHGRSDGARGHIGSYALTDEMIGILNEHICKTFPGIPVFIYGHSLGGGIVLDHLVRRKPSFRGAIVTSPWIKLAFQPSRFKILLAGTMRHILPGLTQPSGLVVDHISHDSEVVQRYNSDPLVHDRISVSLFHNAMNAAAGALRNARQLEIPLLLMHGSSDMICSPEGSLEIASATDRAELKIWDGGYHELHNELFKEDVFSYLLNWMTKQLI